MSLWKDAGQRLINIFGRSFFKSALEVHGGDDERGDGLPKSIAAPTKGVYNFDFFIYRIDKYLYSSRQTRPLMALSRGSDSQRPPTN